MPNFLQTLDVLKPDNTANSGLTALDLFAGCGGLALGFEAMGIETIGYEKDADAVSTYNKNLTGRCVEEVLSLDTNLPDADLIIGGPPCQPFSVGGSQQGLADSRDGFPVFINAVEKIKPKVFVFENVRGMMYRNKRYLSEIISKLQSCGYEIEIQLLKAVNFQVPQNRERLFVVGHHGGYTFPTGVKGNFTAGDAVEDIAFRINDDDIFLSKSQDTYVAKYEKASNCINPRDLHLDRPARTVTCRNLAGATGDMLRIRLPDGRRKRLNVREGARLQSFPDWFNFSGSKNSQFNQIGNAVPPMLSYHLAKSILMHLLGAAPEVSQNEQLAMF